MVVLCRSQHANQKALLLEVIKTYGGRTAYSYCATAATKEGTGALLSSLGPQPQLLSQSCKLRGGQAAAAGEEEAAVSLKLGVQQQKGPVLRPRSTLSLRSQQLHESGEVVLDGDDAMAAAAADEEEEEEEEREEEEKQAAVRLSFRSRSDDGGDYQLMEAEGEAEDEAERHEVGFRAAHHVIGTDAVVFLEDADTGSEGLLIPADVSPETAMVTLSALLLRVRGGERPGDEGQVAALAELHYAAASADYATLLQRQKNPPRTIMTTMTPLGGEGEEEEEEELEGEAELLAAMASLLRRMRSGEAYCESQRRVWLARNLALEAEVREARRVQLEEDLQRVTFCGMFARRSQRGAARPPRCGLHLPEAALVEANGEEDEDEEGGKRAPVSAASSGLFASSRGRLASFFSCRRRLRWSYE